MKPRQKMNFFKNEFGGFLLQGVRKSARPFERDQVMICVLSSSWSQTNESLKQNRTQLEKIILKQALNFKVKVQKIRILSDQIHFLYKARNRKNVARFFKSICGLIARKQAQTEKGKPLQASFWSERPWTSVLCLKNWSIEKSRLIYEYIDFSHIIASLEQITNNRRAAPS